MAGASGSAASSPSRATSSSRPPRSRPAAGSSRSSSSGSVINARAMSTRLRSPSDRVPYVRSDRCSAPRVSSMSTARAVSISSYSSRQRPSTAYPADTTRSRTTSLSGMRCASAAELRPILALSSATSTRPNRSPRIAAYPEVGCSMAAAIRSNDVFPAPLGPRTTQRSSSSTDQVTGPTNTLRLRRSSTSRKSSRRSGSISATGSSCRIASRER
ncbi:Uncharacterised protein [Mycobacteroides abscessus subsp. abscessus]|nr:Uncharacterised protein [Mycobacteroides abscessus subsp. abscessus]